MKGKRVPNNRVFSFSSRMSQQLRRGTVEAVFSWRSAENQFRPGLFPRQQRLVPVVGDAGLHVRTAKPAAITPFRKGLTIPIPNREMARISLEQKGTKETKGESFFVAFVCSC
jgi:hypothetical protein